MRAIDMPKISGRSDRFDEAMVAFAAAYVDRPERDHVPLKTAVRQGKITVNRKS
jgi:hypothetical protein